MHIDKENTWYSFPTMSFDHLQLWQKISERAHWCPFKSAIGNDQRPLRLQNLHHPHPSCKYVNILLDLFFIFYQKENRFQDFPAFDPSMFVSVRSF